MDTIKGLKRTNYCGDLRIEDVNKEVTLFGWCQRQVTSEISFLLI